MNVKFRFAASTAASALILTLVGTLPGVAQDVNEPPPANQPAPSGGWRKFQPQNQQGSAAAAPDGLPLESPGPAGEPADQGPPPPPPQGSYQQGPPPQGAYQQAAPPAGPQTRYAPATISLPAGTWVTVRVNEPLSSDHNQTGDAFSGTLLEPIVANGLLIARKGQTVHGIVTEAQKAGHVSGVSHLKIEITEIQLADGRQVQVKTRMIERRGNTSYGRDAAAIGTTTGLGAAIGAGVDGGFGAGVGAAAGLAASTIGVMLTRGRATVVYPETPLTFSTEAPLTLDNSQQTFNYVSQQDYNARVAPAQRPRPAYGPGAYGPRPPYYGYYAPYPYPYYYPYWGPSVYLGFGRGWGHRW